MELSICEWGPWVYMYSSLDYSITVTVYVHVVHAFVSVVVVVVQGITQGWSCLLNSPVLTPDSHRQLTITPPLRVSLRLVLSVKSFSIDTRLSHTTKKPPVRVSLRLILFVKFYSVDT